MLLTRAVSILARYVTHCDVTWELPLLMLAELLAGCRCVMDRDRIVRARESILSLHLILLTAGFTLFLCFLVRCMKFSFLVLPALVLGSSTCAGSKET